MDQWYFERDGAPAGPVSFDELQRLATSGVLSRDTRIWSEGMGDWVAAGTVDRLWVGAAAPAVAFAAGPAPAGPFAAAPATSAPLAADLGLHTASHGLALTASVDVDKMVGDMRFVGIFTILYGAFTCLGIISAIIGVPLIMMGLRLREAADQFERYARAGDEASLSAALERQGSYFGLNKLMILISLGFFALYIVFLIVVVGIGSSM